MKKVLSILLISLFVCSGAWAKNLEKKKTELKKIYEAGGISKIEYKKAVDFLENPEENPEKKSKRTFNLSKKKKKKDKIESILKKKDKDKEKIT